jgi:hypothetical protein
VVNNSLVVVGTNFLSVANVSAVVNNSLVVVDASSLPVANVSTVVNGTSAVIEANSLAVPDAFSAVTDALTATLVPTCALIVKLVNSSRHEFQIVPVDCPAPGDYWLAAPQKVHFQSANLIEVTQVKML